MLKSLRGKLIVSLILTIVLTAFSLIALSLYIYKENTVHDRAVRLLAWGQVVGDREADVSSLFREETLVAMSERAEARILLLDRKGLVTADSSGVGFQGQIFAHPEVVTTLEKGKPSQGVYRLAEEGWVMYVTVPIMVGKKVTGLVFLSHDINVMI